MVKVIYKGDVNPCRIKILDMTIRQWGKGEIKEISDRHWKHLKKNVNFSLVREKKEKKVVEEKPKPLVNFDLDRDGDVDSDDLTIAGKVLANAKKIKEEEVK